MICAIVQARMGSRRFPGKVLAPLGGAPMILRQLERIAPAAVDRIVVATSEEDADAPLAECLRKAGIECFRGALDDVLDRMYRAAAAAGAEHVVRLTADCPLHDHRVIDGVLALHREQRNDYTSNTLVRTFPDGLDVEVLTLAALETAWREAREQPQREHVTPFVSGQPERFKLGNYAGPTDRSHVRLTVDYPEDLAVVRAIFDELHPREPLFGLGEIIALLERRPELPALNAHYNVQARAAR
jgi:spore coat polysaccharide biosynthesis protein SpsF